MGTSAHASGNASSLTGSLSLGPKRRLPNNNLSKSFMKPSAVTHSQPSILFKALAYFFKDYLVPGGTDLSEDGQAIFITGMDQLGIPGGTSLVPHDVRNYQLFAKADPMQTRGHVLYKMESPSYFEQLSMYLRYVVSDTEGQEDPMLAPARAALLKAKYLKDEAWEAARLRYIAQDPPPNSDKDGGPRPIIEVSKSAAASDSAFAAYLRNDKAYNDAWGVELKCENAYTKLLGPEMQAIKSRLDTIKFADDRLDYRVGNNMTCTALNEDFLKSGPSTVTPENIYYRPHHALPNYDTICDTWLSSSAKDENAGTTSIKQHKIQLKSISARSWAALGHPELDDAKPQKLSAQDLDMLQALKVFVGFEIEPKAMDVQRGLWNVATPREFGQLAADAPEYLKHPFCKTTKMLIAWSIEIRFRLPVTIGTFSGHDMDFTVLGLQPDGPTPFGIDQLEWVWKTDRLAYPMLLAVLADIV